MADEVDCHGVEPILLVERCHGHPSQVIPFEGLGILFIISLHKPAQQAEECVVA